jgi:hypothetical protein
MTNGYVKHLLNKTNGCCCVRLAIVHLPSSQQSTQSGIASAIQPGQKPWTLLGKSLNVHDTAAAIADVLLQVQVQIPTGIVRVQCA